jgi:peptidoglycan/LPS O-acetylase OafA/YrhL
MNRIPSLDGLRAVSISLVIIAHLVTGNFSNFLAALGVHCFFVISGYLITSLLQKEYATTGRISLRDFYRRRCFRIFPAAFLYIFVVAALIPSSRDGLAYALTYTTAWNLGGVSAPFLHLWSLSIEEQFYLIWPLALTIWFSRRGLVAVYAMILAAVFRLAVALHPSAFPSLYLHYSPPAAMDSIAAGCLLAIYEGKLQKYIDWMAQSGGIALAVPISAWVLAEVFWAGPLSVFWGAVPIMLALSVAIFVARKEALLNGRVITGAGVVSYSIYLWQEPFTIYHRYPAAIALLLTGACACLSYFTVEKPMVRVQPTNAELH